MPKKQRLLTCTAGASKFEYDDLSAEKLVHIDFDGARAPITISAESSLFREISAFRDLFRADLFGSANLDLGVAVTRVLEAAELSLQQVESRITIDNWQSG
jgi:hypothetical protein